MFKDTRNFYKIARNEGFTLGASVLSTIVVFLTWPFVKLIMWMIPEPKDFGPFKSHNDLE